MAALSFLLKCTWLAIGAAAYDEAPLARREILSSAAVAGVLTAVTTQQQSAAAETSAVSAEFVSGLAGGAAQRLVKDIVLHPIDTVKTRLQRAGSRQLTRRAFVDPYAGVLGPLLVGVPAGALFFGVKDATQAALPQMNDELEEAIVVAVANLPYWALRSPTELVKVRQQLDDTGKNAFGLGRDIVNQEGLSGLYRGALESYAYALPTDLVKFLVYRRLKKNLSAPMPSTPQRLLLGDPVLKKAALGSLASATAQLATTPLDVVRTRAMDDDSDLPIPARAARVAAEEGPGALFAGVTPRLLRALVSGGLQFGSYEFTKRAFSARGRPSRPSSSRISSRSP